MSEESLNTISSTPDVFHCPELQPVEIDEIIDVSAFDCTDEERWLYASPNYPPEGNVTDLYKWLRNGPDLESAESEYSDGARKNIDTRTFTRPKKRNNRMSFDSITETVTPSATSRWTGYGSPLKDSSLKSTLENHIDQTMNARKDRKESVPAMLRPTTSTGMDKGLRTGIFSGSGQESMEAFLNMSQSKGIDSFINLNEPDFPDVIMNISQPSEFSFTPMKVSCVSDVSQRGSIEDSQILTDSMMKTSIFADVSDLKNFNDETFLKSLNDETVLECNKDFDDVTFTTNSQAHQEPHANSTFTQKSVPKNDPSSEEEGVTGDTTYTSYPTEQTTTLDKTLVKSPKKIPAISNGLSAQGQQIGIMNVTLDLNHQSDSEYDADADADLENQFPSMENICHNTSTSRDTFNSTFNGPSELRRELLKEVQRNSDHKFDFMYNYDPLSSESIVPSVTQNNTYKKLSYKSQETIQGNPVDIIERGSFENDKKYHTFTKKSHNTKLNLASGSHESLKSFDHVFNKPNTNLGRKLQAPRVLSKVPTLFQKSNPNLTSKDLVSFNGQSRSNIPNLRYSRRGFENDIPRMSEGSLKSKLLPLGGLKSMSERRLLDVGDNGKEFSIKGACGSTESIESTQSAHSAPDLDDRLSVCSESSHTSYRSRPISSTQLHYIARLQEERLKQISTPKPNRRIMENTWVEEEKDLPSPISKSDNAVWENDRNSTRNVGYTVKTSSPISSPVRSAQPPRTENHTDGLCGTMTLHDSANAIKKPEMIVKPLKHTATENTTKLRTPSNWTASKRVSGMTSGIPRPASRIPAPRFSRPSLQDNQTDRKKGYL